MPPTPQSSADGFKEPRLFPLHLTAFEDYMLWDDRTDYPMTFVVEMEFTGKMDRVALDAALPQALARHPLLQATVRTAKGNRECWVRNDEDAPVRCQWGDLTTPISFESEAIDLREAPGLRIWVRADEHRAILTTQFHHATCDGIGSYQFLGDWLWFYAERIGQPIEEPLPPIDFKLLKTRGRASYDPDLFRLPDGKFRSERKELSQIALGRIMPITEPNRPLPAKGLRRFPHPVFPGIKSFEFDKNEYKQLRLVAEERGQSTNELLIERLFVTIDEWNLQNGSSKQGNFCVMMPMDLREPGQAANSASNVVTYALIRRGRQEVRDASALIDSLRMEMVHLKHNRHRTSFMNVLAAVFKYSNRLKRFWIGKKCLASAIISNTGDPTKRFNVPFPREGQLIRAGNLLLEDIRGVPPMRYGTRATISIFTYRRVLKLCVRCDPHLFSNAETQTFLDNYVKSIRSLLPQPQTTTSLSA